MENSIIDLIIRIKNGYMVKKENVSTPYSRFKEELLKKLKQLKFIKDYHVEGKIKKTAEIELLYYDNQPALTGLIIHSKPGRRSYVSSRRLRSVLGGLGVSLISTSKGIMTNRQARKEKIGGELLFSIW